jgi:hypothetical protein
VKCPGMPRQKRRVGIKLQNPAIAAEQESASEFLRKSQSPATRRLRLKTEGSWFRCGKVRRGTPVAHAAGSQVVDVPWAERRAVGCQGNSKYTLPCRPAADALALIHPTPMRPQRPCMFPSQLVHRCRWDGVMVESRVSNKEPTDKLVSSIHHDLSLPLCPSRPILPPNW